MKDMKKEYVSPMTWQMTISTCHILTGSEKVTLPVDNESTSETLDSQDEILARSARDWEDDEDEDYEN